jgi:hypothetical protein
MARNKTRRLLTELSYCYIYVAQQMLTCLHTSVSGSCICAYGGRIKVERFAGGVVKQSLPWVRRLVDGLSSCRPVFDTREVRMGLVADEFAVGRDFPVTITPSELHMHLFVHRRHCIVFEIDSVVKLHTKLTCVHILT